MRNDSSCLDCKNRYPGCHSTCENYKNYKEKLEKIKENKRLTQQNDSLFFKRKRRIKR